jgi:hypothetical protein
MNPGMIFQQRQTRFQASIQKIQRKLDGIAWLRLVVFLFFAGLQVAAWEWGGGWWLLVLFLGLIGFGMMVRWNLQVKEQLRVQQLILQFNEEEERRLEGKLNGFDPGEEFREAAHPYASDLDIFGQHSLYQLVSRATTVFGRRTLARWLKESTARDIAIERQQAGRQLAPEIDWRQEFQAIGQMRNSAAEDPGKIEAWMKETGFVTRRPWLGWLPLLMIPALLAEVTLEVIGLVPFGNFGWILGFNFAVCRMIDGQVAKVQLASEERSRTLKAWAALLLKIEGLSLNATAIQSLQSRLGRGGRTASAEIARLASIVGNLELRSSGLPHFLLNTPFYWDVFCMKRLEKWKADLGGRVMDWFEVVGEVEALSSLATIRFAFPEWVDAEILEGNFLVEGEHLGHPLIPPQQRVSNPVSLRGNGAIWLVTGSNMSGKSTYLRTVGLNAVLALAGAPVCASRLHLSPMQVVTSMRTLDSLEESTSSFYAELKRLASVIHIVQSHPNVLFLLDEILKGTNSRDRQAGARALVHQLHALGGSGLVSTHDVELVDMASAMPQDIRNYSFNCTVTPSGLLDFDYQLTEGPCGSMNAIALMRAMGIQV